MIGCFMRHHPLMHALRFSLPVLPVTELPGAVLISVDNHVMRHECFGAQFPTTRSNFYLPRFCHVRLGVIRFMRSTVTSLAAIISCYTAKEDCALYGTPGLALTR
jgi:hypothetical protein